MLKKLVIIPGGFHPFHAGHKALYDAAVAQFPKADVYIAATDDKSTRPFPFKLKKTLAGIAGIPAHRFVQVKSPFQPKEITGLYDPEKTQLIFVRSDKDSGVSPLPGGFKKDGSESYLQPLKRNKPENMQKHGFMTYLPTVQFGPGMTSATEIRGKWPTMSDDEKEDLIVNLYPMNSKPMINKAIEIFNTVLGNKQPVSMPMGSLEKTSEGMKGELDIRGDLEDELEDDDDYRANLEKEFNKSMKENMHNQMQQDAEEMDSASFAKKYPGHEDVWDQVNDVKETKIIQKDNEVSILPAGGMGSHSEASIKSNLADKLRTLAEMLEDENYDNLEYVIYKSGAMESLVKALRQYQSFKNKRGNRPIKKDVEIDISNEDYLPEDEMVTEYVFQSRPLRVLDNIAARKDVQKFPIKFDDGTEVQVTPKMAQKFMNIYLRKDMDIQKLLDKKMTDKNIFVKTFNEIVKGKTPTTTGVKLGDIK